MPDLVLDYHRLKTPIDHPDSSITPVKLSFGTWQKIAEVDAPSGTTAVDITGLNGNSDKAYLIVFQGLVGETATADVHLVAIPNALSITIYNVEVGTAFDGSTTSELHNTYSLSGFRICRSGWGKPSYCTAMGVLGAVTGRPRTYTGTFVSYPPSQNANAIFGGANVGRWNDSTTNITSLRIAVSANTFSGKIILFKVSL
jgi:hypothetical protein